MSLFSEIAFARNVLMFLYSRTNRNLGKSNMLDNPATEINYQSRSDATTAERKEAACAPCPPCKPPDIWSDDRIFLAWQRTHMSNERTFLAWARTGIALLAFGFVIERFDIFLKRLTELSGGSLHFATSGHIIYLSLFSFFLAGISILFSGIRFIGMRRHIDRGEPKYSMIPDILVIISMVIIIVIAIALSLPSFSAWKQG